MPLANLPGLSLHSGPPPPPPASGQNVGLMRDGHDNDDFGDTHKVGIWRPVKKVAGWFVVFILVAWIVYTASVTNPQRERERGDVNGCILQTKIVYAACRIYSINHNEKYPIDLDVLVKEGLLESKNLTGMKDASATDAGYDYFGDKMTDSDSGEWILLISKWRDSKGRRIVCHNDGSVSLEIPEDKKILHAAVKGSASFERLHAPEKASNDVSSAVKPTPPVETTSKQSGNSNSPARSGGETYAIGAVMRSQNLEVVITTVETRTKVGGDFFEETASDGGLYLAVRWNYKNISSKPINMFNQAKIHLIAPDGTQYNEDLGASAAYASQFNIDEKVLSDLNPGIKVNSATVFEVSRGALSDPSRWSLVVEGDSTMKVKLK